MDGYDDLQRLRTQHRSADLVASQYPGLVGAASASLLLQPTNSGGSYPTIPNSYFTCNVMGVVGADAAGSVAVVTPSPSGGTVVAYNCGGALPPHDLASYVVATLVGGRWFFNYSY